MNSQPFWTEADVISVYTRAQAIEDGVLVDVSEMAQEAGFKFPVALTTRLWHEVITPDERSRPYGQSEEGRLWDVLAVLLFTARHTEGSLLLFNVDFIMKERQQRTISLKAICSGGDDGEPVITIMFPDED